jgi:hypothetical protein
MVQALKDFYDEHGTWDVGPDIRVDDVGLAAWLNLRQQEFKKLQQGVSLTDAKRRRLKQLLAIGYDFGLEGGASLVLSLLQSSCSDGAEASDGTPESEVRAADTRASPPPPPSEIPVHQDTAQSFDGVQAMPMHLNREAGHEDATPGAGVVPLKTMEKFCSARDEVRGDLDILRAEWKEHLDDLDRAIAHAETRREAGMARARRWAVCVESDERSAFLDDGSLAVFESRSVFGEEQHDELPMGIVSGSTEGASLIAAEVQIQRRFQRDDRDVVLSIADLRGGLLASFALTALSAEEKCGFQVLVSDSCSSSNSYLLQIAGHEQAVDTFKSHLSSWILSVHGIQGSRERTPPSATALSAGRQSYNYFRNLYGDSVAFDFQTVDVHKYKVLGYMWTKHKALIGEKCDEACRCVARMPDMLDGFVESLEKDSGNPLGFMTNFAKLQLEPLLEEYPTDTPSKSLERLRKLYTEEPSLRRRFDNREQRREESSLDRPEKRGLSQKIPRKQPQDNGAGSGDLLLSQIAPKKRPPGIEVVEEVPARSNKVMRRDPRAEEDTKLVHPATGPEPRKQGLDASKIPRKRTGENGPMTGDPSQPQKIPRKACPRGNDDTAAVPSATDMSTGNQKFRPGTTSFNTKSSSKDVSTSTEISVKRRETESVYLSTYGQASRPPKQVFDGAKESASLSIFGAVPRRPAEKISCSNKTSWSKSSNLKHPPIPDTSIKGKIRNAPGGDGPRSAASTTKERVVHGAYKAAGQSMDMATVAGRQLTSQTVRRQASIALHSPVSILKKLGNTWKRQRRVTFAETTDGEVLVESRLFDPGRPVNPIMGREPSEPLPSDSARPRTYDEASEVEMRASDARALSRAEVSRLATQGSFSELLNSFEAGSAAELSICELVELRNELVATRLDQQSVLKTRLLTLYQETAELIAWHQSEETFFSLVTRIIEVDGLQERAVAFPPGNRPTSLKVKLVLHHESKASSLLELLEPMRRRVVFGSQETIEDRFPKQLDKRSFEVRLRSMTDDPKDNGAYSYIGSGTLTLHNAYVACRNCPGVWQDFRIEIKPFEYEGVGAVVDGRPIVLLQAKISDLDQEAHNRIGALIDKISSLNRDIAAARMEMKVTSNIMVSKSSLLHVAVAVGDVEGVVELLSLGAKPKAVCSDVKSAVTYADISLERPKNKRRDRIKQIQTLFKSALEEDGSTESASDDESSVEGRTNVGDEAAAAPSHAFDSCAARSGSTMATSARALEAIRPGASRALPTSNESTTVPKKEADQSILPANVAALGDTVRSDWLDLDVRKMDRSVMSFRCVRW